MMRGMKYANNRYRGASLMEEMAGISLPYKYVIRDLKENSGGYFQPRTRNIFLAAVYR